VKNYWKKHPLKELSSDWWRMKAGKAWNAGKSRMARHYEIEAIAAGLLEREKTRVKLESKKSHDKF